MGLLLVVEETAGEGGDAGGGEDGDTEVGEEECCHARHVGEFVPG